MTSRIDRLRAYIEAARDLPVVGLDDCGPWVAVWVTCETGIPIAVPSYRSRDEIMQAIVAAGGLAAFVAPLMTALAETYEPKAGDVGVVFTGTRSMCAIFCGHDHVVVRGEAKGAYFLRARRIERAWALP